MFAERLMLPPGEQEDYVCAADRYVAVCKGPDMILYAGPRQSNGPEELAPRTLKRNEAFNMLLFLTALQDIEHTSLSVANGH